MEFILDDLGEHHLLATAQKSWRYEFTKPEDEAEHRSDDQSRQGKRQGHLPEGPQWTGIEILCRIDQIVFDVINRSIERQDIDRQIGIDQPNGA